jgi:hypothetical protein
MRLERLTWAHAVAIADRVNAPSVRDEQHVCDLIAAGPAFACMDGALPFALAGVADHGFGRATAWAYVAHDARHAAVAVSLTRTVRRFLDAAPFRRVECITVEGPTEWHRACGRWARALGFDFEGVAPFWLGDGSDALRWYRLRGA